GLSFADHARTFERVEELGFSALWTNEIDRWDAFSPLLLAAQVTRVPLLGTAIATAFVRGPALLAMQASAAANACAGRLVLGIGPGSPVTVGAWNGMPFTRPVARMEATTRALRRLLKGQRVSDAELGLSGFTLASPPADETPIFV